MQDRRVRRTKNEIKKAFLKLAIQKEIDKITVSEISQIADIGRGTFYLHYQDVYDLHYKIEYELGEDFKKTFSNDSEVAKKVEAGVNFFDNNREIFMALLHTKRGLSEFQKTVYEELLNIYYKEQKTNYGKIEVLFVSAGLIEVIEKWTISDDNITKEELIKILTAVLHRFVE